MAKIDSEGKLNNTHYDLQKGWQPPARAVQQPAAVQIEEPLILRYSLDQRYQDLINGRSLRSCPTQTPDVLMVPSLLSK